MPSSLPNSLLLILYLKNVQSVSNDVQVTNSLSLTWHDDDDVNDDDDDDNDDDDLWLVVIS